MRPSSQDHLPYVCLSSVRCPPLDAGPAAGDPDEGGDASFTITDLAREFDITPRAIRFYEDQACCRRTARGRAGAAGSIPPASARA